MMMQQAHPLMFILGPVFLFLSGILLLMWGRSLPVRGVWLVWVGLFLVLALLGLDTGIFLNQSFVSKSWMAGWIWDKHQFGAITVGLFQNRLSAIMILALTLGSALVLLNSNLVLKEQYPERVLAGFTFSVGGVCLAWIAMTPWVVFLSLVLCLLGSVFALSSLWRMHSQADAAIQLIIDRSLGLILALVGTLILVRFYPGIFLHEKDLWLSSADYSLSKWVGAILLVLGLFMQLQPFPLLKWLRTDVELVEPFRVLLCQLCPAWAAFGFLVRLEPQFNYLGLFPAFGWVALISSLLTFLSGLFQQGWRQGINMWLSGGLSLSICILSFCGALPATSLLIGVSFGSLVLSIFYSNVAKDSNEIVQKSKQWSGLKVSLFLAISSGTGMIGFISAKGLFDWVLKGMHRPGLGVCFIILFSFFSLLGWKIAWGMSRLSEKKGISWSAYTSVILFILLSFGLIWTGSLTGQLLPGESDLVVKSLLDTIFESTPAFLEGSSEYFSALGLYVGVLIFSFIFAYWSIGRKEDQWQVFSSLFPKWSNFIRSGYGLDLLGQSMVTGLTWAGGKVQFVVDQKLSSEWLPRVFDLGIKRISRCVFELDGRLVFILNHLARGIVEIPAKFLQTLQTGDLRWYLFLSLGSGFALLTYFLMR